MQESTKRESSRNEGDSEQGASPADSEATSKETLSDVEENEEGVGSGTSGTDSGPSPDGAFHESKETGPI